MRRIVCMINYPIDFKGVVERAESLYHKLLTKLCYNNYDYYSLIILFERKCSMRYSRQNKILDIINTHEVETQERLVTLLKKSGYKVTQATISRDIKELQLVKTLSSSGKYKYTVGASIDQPVSDRFVKIFKETIQTVVSSGNIIVVKTLSGCASAAGEAIDTLNFPNVVGSIAGDNTLFLVVNDPANVPALVSRFNEMIK